MYFRHRSKLYSVRKIILLFIFIYIIQMFSVSAYILRFHAVLSAARHSSHAHIKTTSNPLITDWFIVDRCGIFSHRCVRAIKAHQTSLTLSGAVFCWCCDRLADRPGCLLHDLYAKDALFACVALFGPASKSLAQVVINDVDTESLNFN